jgi:hypothetical protein
MAIQDMTKGKTSCTYKETYLFIKNTVDAERKENTTARCVIYIYIMCIISLSPAIQSPQFIQFQAI